MEIKDHRPPLSYQRLKAAQGEMRQQIADGLDPKKAEEVVLRKYFPLNTRCRVRGPNGP